MFKDELDYIDFKLKNAIVNEDKNEISKIHDEIKKLYRKYNDGWFDGENVELINVQILSEYETELKTFWLSDDCNIKSAITKYRKEGWNIQKVFDSLKTVEFSDNQDTLYGKRLDLYFKYGIVE